MLIDLYKGYLSEVRAEQLAAVFICFLLFWGFVLKKHGRLHVFMLLFCAAYSTFVLAGTLLGRPPGSAVSSAETLFSTWKGAIAEKKTSDLYEIVLNVLLFLPMGMILTVCGYDRKKTVLRCFLISLILELLQLFTGCGIFEICDLVHNTLGGFLGAVICTRAAELLLPGRSGNGQERQQAAETENTGKKRGTDGSRKNN